MLPDAWIQLIQQTERTEAFVLLISTPTLIIKLRKPMTALYYLVTQNNYMKGKKSKARMHSYHITRKLGNKQSQ